MARLDAHIGNVAQILGYRLDSSHLHGDGVFDVTLYWKPLTRTPVPYSVFVHLFQPNVGSLAQRDTYPGQGNWSTTVWDPGQPFVETFRLHVPPDALPVAGGQILVLFGWRAIFWTLAAFGFLCLAAVLLALGESLPPERRARGGLGDALRTYVRLLADRGFMRYNLSGALVISGMFVYIFGSPFVFMEIHGVRPDHYGWLFGLNAAGLIVASQCNRALLQRVAETSILSRALVVTAAAGVLLLAAAWSGRGGLSELLLPLFVYISSLGFVLPNVVAAALAPQGRNAGSAAALLGTVQFGAGAAVGTLLGALGNGTAVPMAGLIAACGLSALAVHRLLA